MDSKINDLIEADVAARMCAVVRAELNAMGVTATEITAEVSGYPGVIVELPKAAVTCIAETGMGETFTPRIVAALSALGATEAWVGSSWAAAGHTPVVEVFRGPVVGVAFKFVPVRAA